MSKLLTSYDFGKTASLACQVDQRFSYCLYVPRTYAQRAQAPRILVAMHDTGRQNQPLRDLFAEYAESSNTIIIAPLFPGGIIVPGDLENYKYLRFHDIRFDEVLISMVEEVAARYCVDGSRFSLFGFSGGAHFSHRFLYVHPDRLNTVIVASPGSVTLPTAKFQWWAGLQDFETIFGMPVPWDRIRAVPVHLMVGSKDVNPKGIVLSSDSPNWIVGADAAGANRLERLRSLFEQLKHSQAQVTFEELADIGHEVGPIVKAAIRYFGARNHAAYA